MSANCVLALVRWLQKNDPGINLYNFFTVAHLKYYGVKQDFVVTADMADMAKYGVIPVYVVVFMRKTLYPELLRINPHPEQKLLL